MSQQKIKVQKKSSAKKKKKAMVLPSWFVNRKIHLMSIFLLGFLLYANTFMHDYALDDAIVITDNMFTTEGFKGIPGILSKDTFFGFFKTEGKANLVAGGRYRPISLVLFAIEYQIFGNNPFIGHLMNALWYSLTGILLYLLLFELFKPAKNQVKRYWIPLVATLVFIAHPLHTEAVANIKGRDEILTLLFSLSAVLLSLRAFKEKKTLLHLAAGTLFFLALLSKENAVTFLAILPLTFYFFTQAKTTQIVAQCIPFITATILFFMIRFAIFGYVFGVGGAPSFELMNNPFLKWAGNGYVAMDFNEKLAIIFYTLGKYVQLLFVPFPLTHDYYPRHVGLMSWGDVRVILSILGYVGAGIYALIRLSKKDPVSYAILYYLITISIVSNIVFPVGTNMSERFLFMPSVGFCLLLALLTYQFSKAATAKKFSQLNPYLGGVGAIVILFSIITILRNPAWKDNYTLFLTDIYNSPNSAKLRNAVGGELTAQAINANEQEKKAMLTEAIGHLQEAIRIHPSYKNAFLLLGNANSLLDNYQQAINQYDEALAIDSEYQEALQNKAITYRNWGRYLGEKQNNLAASIQKLMESYRLTPNDYETLRLLGVANGILGNNNQAIDFFSKALALDPRNADALYNLGTAYHASGNSAKGQEYHQQALAIDPNAGQPKN